MATSVATISAWFDAGKVDPKNTHMIVVCDTYDWEDYPVYVTVDEDAKTVKNSLHGKNMQRVMEVYSFAVPKDEQVVGGTRVFNY